MHSISGSTVTAQDGSQIDLKLIKVVPSGSKDPVRIEQKGVQTRTRQANILQPFANRLKRELQGRGAVPGQDVANLLRNVAKFRAAAAEARLNNKSLVKNFVNLFPDLFKHEMRGNTFYVSLVT